ncbi:MAG TPA: hypothetical protein VGK33_21360 [Chloroflexota bacterium]
MIALAAGVALFGAQIRLQPQPTQNITTVGDTATPEQQRFASQLRPIHAEIQQDLAETSTLVAMYQSGGIDKTELQQRLAAVLSSYHDAAGQVDSLQAPANMQSTVQAYRDTLGALTQSGSDLSKAYDDGDEGRVAAALAQSLHASAQWQGIPDVGGA